MKEIAEVKCVTEKLEKEEKLEDIIAEAISNSRTINNLTVDKNRNRTFEININFEDENVNSSKVISNIKKHPDLDKFKII